MKCPKYIKEMIRWRTNHAAMFLSLDCEIAKWCDKHGVETDMLSTAAVTICEPYMGEKCLLEDIEKAGVINGKTNK